MSNDTVDTEPEVSSCENQSKFDVGIHPEPKEDLTEGDAGDETALATRPELARQIRNSGRVGFATGHVSGVRDEATANHNINQTAQGQPAKRSSYGNAPGGAVWLGIPMLQGMLALTRQYTFRVSEIAGGSHSPTSRHYRGTTLDVDVINGRPVNRSHPNFQAFMNRARQLGAIEVLGPGSPGHDTHVHCGWP